MKHGMVVMVAIVAALSMGGSLYAQSEETAAIKSQLQAIKNVEAEIRIPALYKVKSIGEDSAYPQVKLVALSLLREPVKSSLDHVRIPAIYAISDIANSTDDVGVERDALRALSEPMKASTVDIRIVAIDALNIIVGRSKNRNALLSIALDLLNEPVDSAANAVRMPAVNSILQMVEGSGSEAAYQKALNLLRQPIASGTKEIRFMTIDAVERIGTEAGDGRTKEMAIDVLSEPKRSDWSDALVDRAYTAEFKIRQGK